METITKASDHVKPCNIEQSERHNRRDADYIASLNPRILYIRTELIQNNESYVAPDMKGVSLQQHYDAIKAMVKQKTGRAMQEKKVTVIGKNGKPKERNGSSPIRESVVNIKFDTAMADLLKYTEKVQKRWGVRAIQIHIHKDEGHFTNPDDISTWIPNFHAHIIWDWMNHETGKSYKLGKKDMEELQDMAAETLEMERGQRKSETGREHLERNDYILYKQEKEIQQNQKELDEQKTEIQKMAKASLLDKFLNSGLSPAVRKAISEREESHKEELRQALTAYDENGKTIKWKNGKKAGLPLTWDELLKLRDKQYKEKIAKVDAEKDAVKTSLQKSIAQAIEKAQNDCKAEMKKMYDDMLNKERFAYDEDGRPIVFISGPKKGQQVTKEERIKSLQKKIIKQEESNNTLLERLKAIRDIILAGLSLNFRKVVQIIIDQWKAEVKHFSKELKDFLNEAMSGEKTVKGRRSYVSDAIMIAKIVARTDQNWEPNDKTLAPLEKDAIRIADGTWESYHQQRNQLYAAAVKSVVEMGNCPTQRHLNQKQADAIASFFNIDGGDRKQLCNEIWKEACPRIASCWHAVTQSALVELSIEDKYSRSCGLGRSL